MYNSILVHIFLNLNHLSEEVAADFFTHCGVLLEQIEEKLALDVFEYQVYLVNLSFLGRNNNTCVTMLIKLDNTPMMQTLNDIHFFSQAFKACLYILSTFLINDFDSAESGVIFDESSEPDLGSRSFPQDSYQLVSIVQYWIDLII